MSTRRSYLCRITVSQNLKLSLCACVSLHFHFSLHFSFHFSLRLCFHFCLCASLDASVRLCLHSFPAHTPHGLDNFFCSPFFCLKFGLAGWLGVHLLECWSHGRQAVLPVSPSAHLPISLSLCLTSLLREFCLEHTVFVSCPCLVCRVLRSTHWFHIQAA